ncbi:MAG: hypothetical protein H6602_07810 [Flavobacteriales bacterium]|nr:hypothetical protein [Flavobacteriales bacterium]
MKRILTSICLLSVLASHAQTITDNGTNVGIGVSNPQFKLDVAGSINMSLGSNLSFNGVEFLNTNGSGNIHIGEGAGRVNVGSKNTFIGYRTGYDNTTGSNNIFLGLTSGRSNTTGNQNTFIGGAAGYTNLDGEKNVFIGWSAGYGNQTGKENTFIGRDAGKLNVSGKQNTYIGVGSGGTSDIINATAIGAYAQATQNNTVILGSNANVGIGTSAPMGKLHVVGSVRIENGSQGNGKVLTSDANGNATWQTPTAGVGGTLDAAYDFGGNGLGRTITADAGAIHISGTDGFLSTGTFASGSIPMEGSGVRMMWHPAKAAFRAGNALGDTWDNANIGEYSFAAGNGSKASGYASTAFGSSQSTGYMAFSAGFGNQAVGEYSTALGYFSNAGGSKSTAFGWQSIASADESTALGGGLAFGQGAIAIGGTANGSQSFSAIGNAQGNNSVGMTGGTAQADNSVAIGPGNTAYSYAETSLGIYGTSYTPTSTNSISATDRLFSLGNGTTYLDLSDAMVVLKNGNTGLGTSTPTATLDVVGDIKFTGDLIKNGVPFTGSNWSVSGSNIYRNTGMVGIGTSTPSSPLSVRTTTEIATTFIINSYVGIATAMGTYSAANGNGTGEKWGGAFEAINGSGINIGVRGFATGGSVNYGGYFIGKGYFSDNVGIGNTSPSYSLDVTGDINLTGELLQNGVPMAGVWSSSGNNTYRSSGNVGVGNDSPSYPLDVDGTTATTRALNVENPYTGAANSYGIYASAPQGGTGTKHGVYSVAEGGAVSGHAYAVRGSVSTAGAGNAYAGHFNASSGGTGTKFGVWTSGADYGLYVASGKSYFNADGITIGTTTQATGYMLSVDGKVLCEELKVEDSSNWPDFVFEEAHILPDLYETEAFITENKHLPQVPSKSEVEENGFMVGEMQKILLQKIEEITLHTIRQQKELDLLKEENRLLKAQMSSK